MQVVDSPIALRTQVKNWHQQNKSIALVPTMGKLHDGHLSLVTKAKELADKVVVSIFVNPLQFNDQSDLSAYPRTLSDDITRLSGLDCDLVFTPSVEVMYPTGLETHTLIHVPGTDDKLCGLGRPGHLDGVATVVTKLLNMVQADIAVFGEKDYQQLLLVRQVAYDLSIPVDVVGAATFREKSGLAMSSRNQYLTQKQRLQAPVMYQTLLWLKQQLTQGEDDYITLQSAATEQIKAAGLLPEYIDIRRADNLELAQAGKDKSLRILAAAQLGKARLIDNISCDLA